MNTQEINSIIDYQSNAIMSEIINDIIEDRKQYRVDKVKLWEEYDGDVAIKTRKRPTGVPDYKANNRIPNGYRSMIVDQGVGYTFGKQIVIDLSADDNTDNNNNALTEFKNRNDVDDLDLETALYSAICGTTARLCYIDKEANERVVNIPAWEVAYIVNKTNGELEYGMIYYKIDLVTVNPKGIKGKEEVWYVEWYDKTNVRFYVESPKDKGRFAPDLNAEKPVMPHGFKEVPIVEFPNNDARKGDFVRVGDLIDAYDRLFSDAQNELEDFRSAYMKFKGIVPTPEVMEMAKSSGAFGSEDEDFDVEFLVKELSGVYLENHKKTANENIFKFSKRVDMNDEKFSGATQSGENRKWKLLALENDAGMKERKFTKAMRKMYKILSSSWSRKGIVINPLTISFQFTRNLPVDLAYYGDIITKLVGKIPLETLYSLLPFIENVDEEIKKWEERYGAPTLDAFDGGQIDDGE